MDIKTASVEELEARMAEIRTELDAPEADLDALEAEVRSIKDEMEARKAAEAKRAEIRAKVANGEGTVIKKIKDTEDRKEMTIEEIRSSKEYIDAYANYIKTGKNEECRALLTENVGATGTLPVPVLVDQIVRTAWENNAMLSRVRRTYFRGNVKTAFELSATGAVVHTEGQDAPDEETLVLGIVTMIPANIKKWIRISDEAVAMGGEDFLRYIYDELTYQILKKLSEEIVGDVVDAAAASTKTAVGVPVVKAAPSVTALPTAAANLSDEATNLCVVMNRLTEVEFLAAYAAGQFAVDPFAGMTKVYTSALKAYSAAAADETYAIVGDLSAITVNYPEGDGVVIKYDDLTEAEADMVKIVGRQYAAHAITAPGRLVKVTK